MNALTFTHVFSAEGFKPCALSLHLDISDPLGVGITLDNSDLHSITQLLLPEQYAEWFKSVAELVAPLLTDEQEACINAMAED